MCRPGIEPGSLAWKAKVIPLDHRHSFTSFTRAVVRSSFGTTHHRHSLFRQRVVRPPSTAYHRNVLSSSSVVRLPTTACHRNVLSSSSVVRPPSTAYHRNVLPSPSVVRLPATAYHRNVLFRRSVDRPVAVSFHRHWLFPSHRRPSVDGRVPPVPALCRGPAVHSSFGVTHSRRAYHLEPTARDRLMLSPSARTASTPMGVSLHRRRR